jgi:hypothetical protein
MNAIHPTVRWRLTSALQLPLWYAANRGLPMAGPCSRSAASHARKQPVSACLWTGIVRSRIESTWDLWPLAAKLLKSQRRADGDVLGRTKSSVARSFAQLGRAQAADSEVSELRFFIW